MWCVYQFVRQNSLTSELEQFTNIDYWYILHRSCKAFARPSSLHGLAQVHGWPDRESCRGRKSQGCLWADFLLWFNQKATIPTRDLDSFARRPSPTKMSLNLWRSFLVDLDQREAPASSASPWMKRVPLQRKWCFWVQLAVRFGKWNGCWATATVALAASATMQGESVHWDMESRLVKTWLVKTCMTLCCIFQSR